MTDQPDQEKALREKCLRIARMRTPPGIPEGGSGEAWQADEILALVREEREAAAIAVDQWPIVRNLEAKLAASEQAREKAEAHARARERAVVEGACAAVCGACATNEPRIDRAVCVGGIWLHVVASGGTTQCFAGAIRERYAEILREEGKP